LHLTATLEENYLGHGGCIREERKQCVVLLDEETETVGLTGMIVWHLWCVFLEAHGVEVVLDGIVRDVQSVVSWVGLAVEWMGCVVCQLPLQLQVSGRGAGCQLRVQRGMGCQSEGQVASCGVTGCQLQLCYRTVSDL